MFENISMKSVQQVINFESSFKGDNTIPELQTKGVTALCKILSKKQYAYLADEVGMGKTYQAIGVISMLLQEKPNAKILIIAPNRSVQSNWERELGNFQRENLKKKNINDISFREKNFVETNDFLGWFSKEVKKENKNINLFIIRLTTFSRIAESVVRYVNDTYEDNNIQIQKLFKGLNKVTEKDTTLNYRYKFNSSDSGKICGKFLRKYTLDFDLVVIDEAQNMRNENNKTTFLNYWLGLKRWEEDKSTPIGQVLSRIRIPSKKTDSKFLLLSATPAHRNIECLRNQLLYFETEIPSPKEITHEYLSKFLIRRLRKYDNENKTKVRKIIVDDVAKHLNENSSESLKQRLFIALIQSKLAKKSKNTATYKIGFLETFESYEPSDFQHNDDETGETGKEFENGGSQENRDAPDKRMLQQISRSFFREFREDEYPPHPKLSFMEKEIEGLLLVNFPLEDTEDKAPEKAVIFVRRLASVRELKKRLIKRYEEQIISYWGKEFKIKNATFQKIRNKFEELYNRNSIQDISIDGDSTDEEAPDEADSELLKWIALKQSHRGRGYYAVSKFKRSLLKNKPNSYLFSENYYLSLFGKDDIENLVDDSFVREINEYIAGEPKRYILEYSNNKRYNSTEILPLCCYLALRRKKNNEAKAVANFLENFYEIKEKVKVKKDGYSKKLIIKTLKQDSLWNHMNEYGVDISNQDLYKREILKAIVEKYLKSSEAVLELMYCYVKSPKNKNLCCSVMDRLFSEQCSCGIRIKKLFENGDLICKELFGGKFINYESELRNKLGFLDSQQWVVSAIGGNKGNERLIKRFNTPFYPDIIVCTDVLKEGINLHLFCNRIYHYGLAWTPGDLEQRIGRIDRFFSKTHRERLMQENIPEEEKTKILINYPYMGKSVDEYQLKQVLKFKLSADILLDSKGKDQKDIKIDLDDKSIEDLANQQIENIDNCPYSGEVYWST